MATLGSFLALVNASRVMDDLRALSRFGSGSSGVEITRPALSEPDIAARRWVMTAMEAVGMNGVQIDGLGSAYGSVGPDNVPALLMGSHTDTRPGRSWLDGTLGIAFALEAARVLRDGGASDFAAWSIVDWADGEGRFGTLGASSAFVGQRLSHSQELWRARRSAGLAGIRVMHASGRHGGWVGYIEAHVEPGVELAHGNATLGVVDAVVGSREVSAMPTLAPARPRHAHATPITILRPRLTPADLLNCPPTNTRTPHATPHTPCP